VIFSIIVSSVHVYRMLYWTDWSSKGSAIYRSSVVNPARQTLISGGLYWPNALTIDFRSNYLANTVSA